MRKTSHKVGAMLLFAILVSGCSKSGSNPGGANSGGAPGLILPNVWAPQSKSATADTSQGYLEVNTHNSLLDSESVSLRGYLAGTPTQSGNVRTWNFSIPADSLTGKWTATPDSGGYYWTFDLYFPGQPSFRYLAGLVSTDGKTGNLNVPYNQQTNQPVADCSWSTNASGQVTGIVYVNDFLGIVGKKYVYTNKTDKSGTLNEWQALSNGSIVQTWEIMWNANQSEQYTEWDTTGTIIDSGTWN